MASEGLSDGAAGIVSFLGRTCHIMMPAITTTITTKAGKKSFFRPKVTVISLEVRGFLLGVSISVVGMPFSIFVSSERTSPAL